MDVCRRDDGVSGEGCCRCGEGEERKRWKEMIHRRTQKKKKKRASSQLNFLIE